MSSGRAGLRVQITARPNEAAHFGRRTVPRIEAYDSPDAQEVVTELFDEAADYVEVVRRLWDSWEDDAEIRDVSTGRFIDRDKLHYIDFEGRHFSVKGPSITPRPPQGQPVVSALAHDTVPYRLVARQADIGYVTPHDTDQARAIVAEIRAEQRAAGRADEPLHVFGDLVVFLDDDPAEAAARRERLDALAGEPYTGDARIFTGTPAQLAVLLQELAAVGLTGFRLRPAVVGHDLPAITRGLVPELQRRGVFRRTYEAETLRGLLGLPRPADQIYDLDVVGRPDTFTVLAALAAVTERLGLTGTINSTFNEPYEVARQFASLDHLSDGRAAWNVVTSWDAFTGENFRRGGFLPQEERYSRAKEFLATANELFDSWNGDEIVADRETGVFLRDAKAGAFVHTGRHFDIEGRFNVPRSPQGRPVVFQAGDSDEGREFAASSADAIFSRYASPDAGRAFYTDVKNRLARYGRRDDQLLILPAASFILGDTDEEAEELAHDVRRQQVSGATAIKHLEFVWNRDLSSYDPEGPLPDIDPDVSDTHISKGRAQVRMYRDPLATAREWRELAAAHNWSIRDLVIETGNRQNFIGTAETVAHTIDAYVQSDAADGFILVPHITPTGLDTFADKVVPLLQERGVFRADYEGTTLRDHLGLDAPS